MAGVQRGYSLLILDTECYTNYFLIAFKDTYNGDVSFFELHDDQKLCKIAIREMMENNTTVSFNGLSYDLPMITAALEGFSNKNLKRLSDKIIKSNLSSRIICRNNNLDVPQWDHIDIIEVAPGRASLKIYGGRLNAVKMQSLPIKPDELISSEQRPLMRSYCKNDLNTTELLMNSLLPAIDLRVSMSKQYNVDVRSKSDAQIAETIIKSELNKITGMRYRAEVVADNTTFRYGDPKIITFKTKQLQDIFVRILETEFGFSGNGSIKLPNWLKDTKIKIGDADYQMGIGGLHSCEKNQLVEAGDDLLFELDVASYYPSIILQQRLAPKTTGNDFLELYQNLVERRLKAKKDKDVTTANTLKICLNGSFGKLGSKYSFLYSPALLLQTTITGQLALLMLIERVERAGVAVVSANTDGIVCRCTLEKENRLEEVYWDWQLDTSFTLERTDYSLLASRDVNNYLAITPAGKFKGKGIFNTGGLQKNPDKRIIYKAVANFLLSGTPIDQTIRDCDELAEFVTIRRVNGGAVWRGELLGNAIRYYNSTDVPFIEHIEYENNSNKVPKSSGCKPIMNLPDEFPDDVDYKAYIDEAYKLLGSIGYVRT